MLNHPVVIECIDNFLTEQDLCGFVPAAGRVALGTLTKVLGWRPENLPNSTPEP